PQGGPLQRRYRSTGFRTRNRPARRSGVPFRVFIQMVEGLSEGSRLSSLPLRILRTCHRSVAAEPLSFPIAKLDPSNSIPHVSSSLAPPRSKTHQSPGAQWAKDGGAQ